MSTNGFIAFNGGGLEYADTSIPDAATPNGALYADWDDFVVDADASVRTALIGTAPERRFVVEWHDVLHLEQEGRMSFEVVFDEASGAVVFQYSGIDETGHPFEVGQFATIGIENATGDDAFQFSHRSPVLDDGVAIRFNLA